MSKEALYLSFSLPPLKQEVRQGKLPLSLNEQAAWIISQENIPNVYLNMKMLVFIETAIDKAILESAFNHVIEQHEILRTTYHQDEQNKLYRQIHKQYTASLLFYDLQSLKDTAREEQLHYLAKKSEHKQFKLDTLALFELVLIKVSSTTCALIFSMHHIIGDGQSIALLLNEVMQVYRRLIYKQSISFPALPITYTDYAIWQQKIYHQGLLQPLLDYWDAKITQAEPLLLPYDRIKDPLASNAAGVVSIKLDKEKILQLMTFAGTHKISVYILLMATFQVLLKQLTGQKNQLIETILANRISKERSTLLGILATDGIALYTVNEQQTVIEFLQHLLEQTFALNKLQQDCGPLIYNAISRKFPGMPVVGVNFHSLYSDTLFDFPIALDFSYFSRSTLPGNLDLFLEVWLMQDSITLDFIYRSGVFNQETLTGFALIFTKILDFLLLFPDKKLDEILMLIS